MTVETKTVGFLLLGGLHHLLHIIPVAAALKKNRKVEVIVFVTTEVEKQACRDLMSDLDVTSVDIRVLKVKWLTRLLSPKRAILLSNLNIWNSLDALIVAERTSTILRKFSKRLPPFIHIPHGAGDRAKSYDPRIALFDHVLVAGNKDKTRMIDLDLVEDTTCHVTGYIKPYAVNLISPDTPVLFNNGLPTVLYNPHFEPTLSSWENFGLDLLKGFSKQRNMNFIFAPHVRLFSGDKVKSSADLKALQIARKEIEAFHKYENIHIDLGSGQSSDMTYTRAADIYLGDVSSQVYEFLSTAKPCVFIADSETHWRDNPDYSHWAYGPVVHSVEDVMAALKRADTDLSNYRKSQEEGCLAATGDATWDPLSRATEAIERILNVH